MSKAFTKEDDDSAKLRLDDLPQSPHPNLVTPEGLADLERRLSALVRELAELRARPESVAGRQDIAVVERDLRYVDSRLAHAILVDPKSHATGVVAFGAEVEILMDEDKRQIFRIVGEDEADPKRGLISPYSPLGIALMGAELGDTVEWRKPTGVIDIEIVAIRFY